MVNTRDMASQVMRDSSPKMLPTCICACCALLEAVSSAHLMTALNTGIVLLPVLLQFTEQYNLDGTESLAKRRDFRKGGCMPPAAGLAKATLNAAAALLLQ
jgi:hypothetical protein